MKDAGLTWGGGSSELSLSDEGASGELQLSSLAAELRHACSEGHFLEAWNTLVTMTRQEAVLGQSAVDLTDEDGETALTLAATNGRARILEALLEKGANDRHCPSENTPIPMVTFLVAWHKRKHNECVACTSYPVVCAAETQGRYMHCHRTQRFGCHTSFDANACEVAVLRAAFPRVPT
jgi:ankyrin repeat protein